MIARMSDGPPNPTDNEQAARAGSPAVLDETAGHEELADETSAQTNGDSAVTATDEPHHVAAKIEEIPAQDGAAVLENLTSDAAADVAEYLDPETAGRIMAEMDPTLAASVLTDMEPVEASMVVAAMDPDDAVD